MSTPGDRLASRAYIRHNTVPIRWLGDQIQILDTVTAPDPVRAAVRVDTGLAINHEALRRVHIERLYTAAASSEPANIRPAWDRHPWRRRAWRLLALFAVGRWV